MDEVTVDGRLHFCSHSFIFVPKKSVHPITRLKFSKLTDDGIQQGSGEKMVDIIVSEYVELKKHNKAHPYIIHRRRSRFRFILQHTSREKFFETIIPVLQIWRNNRNHIKIHELLRRHYEQEHRKSFVFNITYFEDFREPKLLVNNVVQVKPLVEIPGKMVLTNVRIYFQPYNNLGEPVVKFQLNKILRVMRRRYLLQHRGLELFCKDDSVFFVFDSKEICEKYYNQLQELNPKIEILEDLKEMTIKWQKGKVSNFDYLLFLNFLADRSFNDLTQYPVFPWVISDYKSRTLDLNDPKTFRDLSKPIGALTKKRLNVLKMRYLEMPEPKFLYGSHYSTPFMVLYYLVRQAPEYMLSLQNGKFDNPDRLFHSMRTTWESVLTNQTDLKELIPEFFQSTGAFLLNTDSLELGTRSDGRIVNKVDLPRWARDAKDFVYKNRQALESPHVSRNLHMWIDLIFGEKQCGEKAVDADNLFHWLTYEGNVDFDKIRDPVERASYQSQIREFGQCPKQLFKIPHPKRIIDVLDENQGHAVVPEKYDITSTELISFKSIFAFTKKKGPGKIDSGKKPVVKLKSAGSPTPSGLSFSKVPEKMKEPKKLVSTPPPCGLLPISDVKFHKAKPQKSHKLHRGAVNSARWMPDKKLERVITASQDASVRIFSLKRKRAIRRITKTFGEMALSCCAPVDENMVIVSSWNNKMYLFNAGSCSLVNVVSCHDDAVSSISVSPITRSQVLTSSWDGTVKLFDIKKELQEVPVVEFDEHNSDEVQKVCFCGDGSLAISADRNGKIVVFDLRINKSVYSATLFDEAINDVIFIDNKKFVCCSDDKTLHLHEIGVGDVSIFESDYKLTCCEILKEIPQCVVTGNDAGILEAWDLKNSGNSLFSLDSGIQSSITSMNFHPDKYVTGHSNGSILFWE